MAASLDYEIEEDNIIYCDEIYSPLRKALDAGDPVTIETIKEAHPTKQIMIYGALRDSAEKGLHPESTELFRSIMERHNDTLNDVSVTVHRGTRQIGGCVTEIRAGDIRVFIDAGANLNGGAELPPIEGLTAGDGRGSVLLISHYHGDHIGRLNDVLPEVSVCMGRGAKAIYSNYMNRVYPRSRGAHRHIHGFDDLDCSPFAWLNWRVDIRPIRADHSAFDAYMFHVWVCFTPDMSAHGILHTGDFRLHGVGGSRTLAEVRQWAYKSDYIICEGTTLSRDGAPPLSEHALRRRAASLMGKHKYVFAVCASTNIDRIGAFYHATPKDRLFVCDGYQKDQLDTAHIFSPPGDTFYDFRRARVYEPGDDGADGGDSGDDDDPVNDAMMRERGFCMLVRQGEYFRRVMERYKDDCLVIYSMWTGYIDDRAKNQGLCDFLVPYRANMRVLHTSGHAPASDLKRLYDVVQPKYGLIPIHTDAPERFDEIVPGDRLILLNDGENLTLTKGRKPCR